VEAFQVEAWVDGAWKTIVEPGNPGEVESQFNLRGGKGHTIGNQVMRWLKEPVTTNRLRLSITRSKACPCITEFSLLRMPTAEEARPVATADAADKPLSSQGWTYSGFAAGQARLAFDGKADTMWSIGRTPSHFVVNMQKPAMVSGISYLPRQDGKTQGMTSRYRIEVSMDGTNWKNVAEGEFGNLRANPVEQFVTFEPQKARYVRFFSTAALDGVGSSVAELKIIGRPAGN
jgi:alpha-L-fucosidase